MSINLVRWGMREVSLRLKWRQHNRETRNRRALAQAVDGASTPAMRQELMVLAGNTQFPHYTR